jgi:selenocysteine lyase/cysteine desulfurase
MLPSLRDQFDIPQGVAYLDSAAYSPMPKRVREAGLLGVAEKCHPWLRDRDAFTAVAERARTAASRLIGAEGPDAIGIVSSVSHGIETAARNIGVPAGSRILHVVDEFPSLTRPWVRLAAEVGAMIEVVPRPAGDGDWEGAFLAAMHRPGAAPLSVVALTPAHWTDGTLIPLERIAEAARAMGAAVVVDATQAVGAMALDVGRIRPDFLAFPTYKWVLGPYSVAFLYAAPHRRSGRPLDENNFNRPGPDFAAGARRYDRGERADPAGIPMAAEGMEMILELGVAAVEERLAHLSGLLAAPMAGAGLMVPARRCGHILGAPLPSGEADRVATALRARHVHVSVRNGGLRVSPHVHLDEADIAQFGAALADVLRG